MGGAPGATLRVAVLDANPVGPQRRWWRGESTTGRGLHLLAARSTSNGVEGTELPGAAGKTVWFTVHLSTSTPEETDEDGSAVSKTGSDGPA